MLRKFGTMTRCRRAARESPDQPADEQQRPGDEQQRDDDGDRRDDDAEHGRDDRDWELRLLPRPLYRYELPKQSKPAVLDGVVFGLVQGTDLEIVLLLEAVRGTKVNTWRWAAARMSDLPLALKLDGKEVWQVEKAEFDKSRAAYFAGTVERFKEPPK